MMGDCRWKLLPETTQPPRHRNERQETALRMKSRSGPMKRRELAAGWKAWSGPRRVQDLST
jgi:hypothetical protein